MAARRQRDPNQGDLFETRAGEIERHAERFAAGLKHAADRASSEEDIRVAVERLLQDVSQRLDIKLEGEHEYTLLRGRVDSVYGSVFVEYKNPSDAATRLGPRLSSPGTRRVVDQIRQRFADMAEITGRRGASLLGVGCDACYFVFVRFVAGEIDVEDPVEVSRWSARRFLRALVNLSERGLLLTPGALAEDFGSQSQIGRDGVAAFAAAFTSHTDDPRVQTFFRQWRILFGEVCGYDVTNPRPELRKLAEYYGSAGDRAVELLFSLHTYYALFMKLLAAHVATVFQRMTRSPLHDMVGAPSSAALRERLTDVEEGGVFRHLGVTNFLEGDLFAWYLSAWTSDLEHAVRRIADQLLAYNPNSLRDNPARARDLLKKLYHELFPRGLRHQSGEYYTPDWLAELTLDKAAYDGNPRTRLLDPACGSGTFLVLALARVAKWLEQNFEGAPSTERVAHLAAANIIGFDLNPLAVLAARTNFLIQFYDLFDYHGPLEIPIYLCDSVLTASEYGQPDELPYPDKPIRVPTSAKLFLVPREVTRQRDTLTCYCNLLAEDARDRSGFSADDFITHCRNKNIPVSATAEREHRQLFDDVRELDRDRRNGVWARFIKNAFAPVFLLGEPVDLVVGNPPWVNWESLPGRMEAEGAPNYRQQVAEVFQRYGLFTLSGTAGRLGGGKKDLSMVFVYSCVDHYLREGGTLAFVITQTVFKTKGAGDGFRHFEFAGSQSDQARASQEVYLSVKSVDDLSAFQPFEGATNRTAVFVCRKSERRTRYPVRYTVWSKTERGRIGFDWSLPQVREKTAREDLRALPVQRDHPSSPWLTAPRKTLPALAKVLGASDYEAYAGCCTWLNGVYWVRLIRETPGGVLIENLHDVGKISVKRVQRTIEPDLLYPLLRGRDVRRWRAEPSAWIILVQDPHTRQAIPEDIMRRRYTETFRYLRLFDEQLRQRSGYRKYFDESDPFYSVYNVGSYTLARWKVVWREQSGQFQATVVGPADRNAPVVPDHKLMLVDCGTQRREAEYLAATLNSAPACLAVRAYVLATSTSTHVLENLAIPTFDAANHTHEDLAKLSRRAHAAAAHGRAAELAEIEQEIDRCAAQLWGLTDRELHAVQETVRGSENSVDTPLLDNPSGSGADPDELAPDEG